MSDLPATRVRCPDCGTVLDTSTAESAAASSGALLFSNPFELIKTRIQLQGELQAADKVNFVYKNMLHGVWTVGKTEGIGALYQGISAAIVHQDAASVCRNEP